MANRTCTQDACESTVKSRGLCGAHYMRWFRDPATGGERRPKSIPAGLGQAVCPTCGADFPRRRLGHTFCSETCCDNRPRGRTGGATPSSGRGSRRPLLAPVADLLQESDVIGARAAMTGILLQYSTASGDCWEWNRSLGKDGYPIPHDLLGARAALHRHIIEVVHGVPMVGMHGHHMCANRACVNPAHLAPATAAENVAEMLARRSYEGRIAALEAALASIDPNHELLPKTVEV